MLNSVTLKNFGPLDDVHWDSLGKINLLLGSNGSGKTFLLKSIYSALRTLEEFRRCDDHRKIAEILFENLYWTFQPERIGDLVSKAAPSGLAFTMHLDHHEFSYRFGKDTNRQINSVLNHTKSRSSNSVFLPAKEVLSLHSIILKSRDQDKVFGFDNTYLDLARALLIPPQNGHSDSDFAISRKELKSLLDGRVEYDMQSNRWQYKKGNQKFPIGVTAEGVKKIAIMDTLLENRYLDQNSILFIDEPESALHPTAISKFLDILATLTSQGVQVFIASHSYFVVKKLFLIAQEMGLSIPVLSADDQTWTSEDLGQGMPKNAIIDESIRLYKEEVGLVLQ